MKYFIRTAFTTEIISQKTYSEWVNNNPEHKDVSFQQFKNCWKMLRTEIIEDIVSNPIGFKIKYLGIISIKVRDIDFECKKDFLVAKRKYTNFKEKGQPIVSVQNPKQVKVTWQKLKNCNSILTLLGSDPSAYLRQAAYLATKKSMNSFSKSAAEEIPTKCEEVKERSIFDMLDD